MSKKSRQVAQNNAEEYAEGNEESFKTKHSHINDELRVKIIDPDAYSQDEIELDGEDEDVSPPPIIQSEPKKGALKQHKGNLLTDVLNEDDIYEYLAGDDTLDSESESDSTDDVGVVGSFIFQKNLSYVPDFFQLLGELPDITELSQDNFDVKSSKSKSIAESVDETKKDIGRFVDPLTGEGTPEPATEPESEPDTVAKEEESEDQEEEEEETDNIVEIPEDDDLLVLEALEETEEVEKKLDEDEVFETFLEMDTPKIIIVQEDFDFEEYARAEETRLFNLAIKEFIYNIMDEAVQASEYVDPKTIMRQKSNKSKLMQKIIKIIHQIEVEQKARLFLNRKTVEYFRRKKYFRPILEDNPETLAEDIQKFEQAKMKLDQQLGIEGCTHETVQKKFEYLRAELDEWKGKVTTEDENFDGLVMKSLVRESHDRLRVVVTNQLMQMSRLRKQISEFRFTLIQRLHTYALLVNKLDKLEDIGNGLRIQDFERLQTETQVLGKKIEERNNELSKLRARCNADLHIMAHMKEKGQMLRNSIIIQDDAYMQLLQEKQRCREKVYNLKLKRGQVRKEIQELSFQGGLIDKPALMHDFDETNDRLKKIRSRVSYLKSKFADIQKKLKTFEGMN